MTEEEAKKRWCPFVRDADAGANVGNEDRAPHWSTCIGSECMAWRHDRWDYKEQKPISDETTLTTWLASADGHAADIMQAYQAAADEGWEPLPDSVVIFGIPLYVGRDRIARGHCGLAGKP